MDVLETKAFHKKTIRIVKAMEILLYEERLKGMKLLTLGKKQRKGNTI